MRLLIGSFCSSSSFSAKGESSGSAPAASTRFLRPSDHVLREVAAGGARVGDELSLLVERLGGAQRALRGETVAGVGVALQLGQVVEERRLLRRRLLLRLADGSRPAAHLLRYTVRGLLLGEAVLFVLEPDAVVGAPFAREAGVDGPELLGLEVLYLPLAVDQELQGRGLDAADGEDVATGVRSGPSRRGSRSCPRSNPPPPGSAPRLREASWQRPRARRRNRPGSPRG